MSTSPLRVIVAGAAGRMGRAIMKEIVADPAMTLVGAIDRAEAHEAGTDAGLLAGEGPIGVMLTSDTSALVERADVIIDFSSPAGACDNARLAAKALCASVIGVTGFTDKDTAAINAAAQTTPIVKSGNMSLGVNILSALVEEAAARLSGSFDIEVVEAHHHAKTDAPSGTALMLGQAAAAGRAVNLDDVAIYAREGQTGPRPDGAIGFAVIRGGGIIGDHDVHFASRSEVVTLSHRALDRSLFAQGALAAARWAAADGRAPALYTMRDVLGMSPPKTAS